ncbi:MarR family winged helix-turn-helix transcriptional regulator [Clavibacter phaseoli]|uniref:MarR family winged helix-turn-helix transcriptional regulator n=1 Tax=Clavibacter phaseoli TaxID=1734031 RepID=UPI001EEDB030|nr:MarR family transcriptional regulator [Clavibacter phaseoli]UKF32477.1 MarR family transcriptional regulator [Clavibacter phaseoli]UKF38502.1 MarR family transcriptional regulator [Clavibacter phaseoli]
MSRRSQELLWSQTGALLPAVARLVVSLYRPHLTPLRLTHPQFLVLLVLELGQPRAVTEIGQLLALTPGTMTPIVKRLESLGYVSRARATPDGRRLAVSLTDSGLALLPDLQDIRQRVTELVGLSPGQRQLLQTVIAGFPHAVPEAGASRSDEIVLDR